jgi:hypothetical protein
MYHPMTGKKTKLVIHFNIGIAPPPIIESDDVDITLCGRYVHISMSTIATWNAEQVTCLKCLDRLTKPFSHVYPQSEF